MKQFDQNLKAVTHKYCDRTLSKQDCFDLPAHFTGTELIMCWKLSWMQRIKILVTGVLWHRVQTQEPCIQPVALTLEYPYVE